MADDLAELRVERHAALAFFPNLDETEWETPIRDTGWRVRDMVAHLGAGCRDTRIPRAVRLLGTDSTLESINNMHVDARRQWPVKRVVREFERRSGRLLRSPWLSWPLLNSWPITFGTAGMHPWLLARSVLLFEWHTHVRHDIAPALGSPIPPTDSHRMRHVLEWMMIKLSGTTTTLDRTDDPVILKLDGPGGYAWLLVPQSDGRVDTHIGTVPRGRPSAAYVTSQAIDFPAWATGRENWRNHDLTITGDHDYAARFLDAISVI